MGKNSNSKNDKIKLAKKTGMGDFATIKLLNGEQQIININCIIRWSPLVYTNNEGVNTYAPAIQLNSSEWLFVHVDQTYDDKYACFEDIVKIVEDIANGITCDCDACDVCHS